jgi:hypothetical protein
MTFSRTAKRVLMVVAILLAPVLVASVRTTGQTENAGDSRGDKWEYLVVSGASSTNFTPTGNPQMRKEPGRFGRESFVLETHLDSLGQKGWELVAVTGSPVDPIYFFKRRK